MLFSIKPLLVFFGCLQERQSKQSIGSDVLGSAAGLGKSAGGKTKLDQRKRVVQLRLHLFGESGIQLVLYRQDLDDRPYPAAVLVTFPLQGGLKSVNRFVRLLEADNRAADGSQGHDDSGADRAFQLDVLEPGLPGQALRLEHCPMRGLVAMLKAVSEANSRAGTSDSL